MNPQLFVCANCPACLTLEAIVKHCRLPHERVLLAKPEDAEDVLALLSATGRPCPGLYHQGQSAAGLTNCLKILGGNHPADGFLTTLLPDSWQAELTDGVLSGTLLFATSERKLSLARTHLQAEIRNWMQVVAPAECPVALLVPYVDMKVAEGLAGGKVDLLRAMGLDNIPMLPFAHGIASSLSGYMDRLRCSRSWIYRSGQGSAGRRAPFENERLQHQKQVCCMSVAD